MVIVVRVLELTLRRSQKKVMGWVKERQAMLAHETATTLGLPLDRPPPQRARTGTVSPPKSSLKQVSSPSRNSTLTLGHMTPVVTRRKPFANLSNGDGPRLTRASAAQKKSLVFTATASLPDPSPGAPKIHTRSEGPGSIPPSELYRQLPSSSPTRPENTRDFAQPPILKFSATSGYSDVDRKRKTLDWACQEQQKRRRIRGIQLHEGRHHGPAATNLELLSLVATSEDIFRCIRPTDEHTASEDVISGSISLLAFKHSRRLPRRDAWR
jgi:hypothetical protein